MEGAIPSTEQTPISLPIFPSLPLGLISPRTSVSATPQPVLRLNDKNLSQGHTTNKLPMADIREKALILFPFFPPPPI